MIQQTDYKLSLDILQEVSTQIPNEEFRLSINKPTGNFFYDPWVLKEEFKGTVWETVYNSLPVNKGEARIINLQPATCYQVHADIDDRYHLNITGESCYLLDFDNNSLHKLLPNGFWYDMDASRLHSAGNFGRICRTQLVVRKLLKKNSLVDPVKVRVTSTNLSLDDSRFIFDQTASKWLNYANKEGIISGFNFNKTSVEFNVELSHTDSLRNVLTENFKLEML
jgi:hypothetical protein